MVDDLEPQALTSYGCGAVMRGVAEADNGDLAIRLFREHRPDVVLQDGWLPGLSGGEALATMRREFPKCASADALD